MTLAVKASLIQLIFGVLSILIAVIVAPMLWGSVAAGVVVMWCSVSYLLYRMWYLERNLGMQPRTVASALYIGQVIKFMVLILGVILVRILFTIHWAAFLIGITIVQIGNILTSLRIKKVLTL